jgi:hypothetical protein
VLDLDRCNLPQKASGKIPEAPTMTNSFPAPWRIVEIPNGFAVDDAVGRQLAVFYGRAAPNVAGHTGYLTIDEARQLAVNFAKLPELLKLASTATPFAKATPRQTRVRAPKQNGRHTSTPLDGLQTNLALPSKIVAPVQRRDLIDDPRLDPADA